MPSPGSPADRAIDLDEPLAPEQPLPHSASAELLEEGHDLRGDMTGDLTRGGPTRRWTPTRVVVTPAALDEPHGQRIVERVEATVDGVPDLDLTAELITHRFTASSTQVLLGWYPRTTLEMDEERRTLKRGRFGNGKHVYPREVMREMRGWFEKEVARRLPGCRVRYWT